MRRRVVLTGIGTINACGEGKDALWRSAIDRVAGISELEPDDRAILPVGFAGRVRDFQPSKYIPNRKSIKVMCRDIQMAVATSFLARQDAGLVESGIEAERTGTCIGAGLFDYDMEELSESFRLSLAQGDAFDTRRFGEEGMSRLFPLWLLKYLPNMPSCQISIAHDLQGPSNTLTADGAGSAAAIEEAYRVIERGMADMMFCGGAQSRVSAHGLLRIHSLGRLRVNGDGSCPYPVFSEEASGLVLGEGGCILILEEFERALKRNANIYAEVVGIFSCADEGLSGGTSIPSRVRVMRGAMEEAKIGPDQIDTVHLNAIGIKDEDLEESKAIQDVFGSCSTKPILVATKTLTGFLGFASGGTEAALAALSLREGRLVPSMEAKGLFLNEHFSFSTNGASGSVRYALVNQFHQGLAHYTMILRRWGNGG